MRMKKLYIGLVVLFSVLLFCSVSHGTIYKVPEEIATIQEAIDLAEPYDVILLTSSIVPDSSMNISGKMHLTIQSISKSFSISGNGKFPAFTVKPIRDHTMVLLDNLTIEGFSHGLLINGATYFWVYFNNCLIRNNVNQDAGAGINAFGWGYVDIANSIIHDNKSILGGGIYLHGSQCFGNIQDSIITRNQAESGAGIYAANRILTVRNTDIVRNHASRSGGGIEAAMTFGWAKIINSRISYNHTAGNGGGIHNTGGWSLLVKNSEIIQNEAKNGGGIYRLGSSDETNWVINSIIAKNEARKSGGGIYFGFLDRWTIINSVIAKNSAGLNGGGIRGMEYHASYHNIANSIFSDNIPNQIWLNPESENSPFQENINMINSLVRGSYPGTGNIDADPMFKDGSYKLRNGSPCIDSGANDPFDLVLPRKDKAGETRINHIVDMGAYETFY
jgi:hypothetical protein